MNKFLRYLFRFLLLIVFILLGMHFFPASVSWTIANRFNLNGEANIPEWYSSMLLFSVSMSSWAIYLLSRNVAGGDRPWKKFWLVFAGVYCYLSLDEGARFHEFIQNAMHFEWAYAYAPFAAIFFLACAIYFIVIRKGEKGVRNWILGGLIVYALGGMVAEVIGYLFRPLPYGLQQVEFVIEEGLEMTGAIIVLMGCLQELRSVYRLILVPTEPGV